MEQPEVTQLLREPAPGVLHFGGARMALLELQEGFWSIRRQVEALTGPRLANAVLQQAGANGGAAFARSLGPAPEPAEQRRLFAACLRAYQAAGFGAFTIAEAAWPIGRVIVRARDGFEAWALRQHGQAADGPVCAYTAGVLVGFVNVVAERRDIVCVERRCQALGDAACEFALLPAAEAGDRAVVAFAPDPTLGRQINLLEMLFERMPMGIAVIDREYRLVRCNPTWAAFIERYTPSQAAQVLPGAYLFDLEPGTEAALVPLFERVFRGETVRQDAVRIESGGIPSFWDIVLSPLYEGPQVVGLLNVSIDATERALFQQTLEQRVEERTSELERRRQIAERLRETIRRVNAGASLDEVLDGIAAQADELSPARFVAIYVLEGEGGPLRARALRGDFSPAMRQARLEVGAGAAGRAVAERRSVAVSDVGPDALEAAAFRAVLAVPLLTQHRGYGALAFYYPAPHALQPDELQLAATFADQAALAIENALLRTQAAEMAALSERNRLARDLHDAVSQTLFSASLIADVLPRLWERDPATGRQKLEELRQLTGGALAEMRALLLELRPAALQEQDLAELLGQLARAFTGRTRVPVELRVEGADDPPPAVREVAYRVVQEALNNSAKHAHAARVAIVLRRSARAVELAAEDDGRGFDPGRVAPDGLGLAIMRERAQAIGAALRVESAPGSGARVTLTWKEARG
ncbi:MAG TPA: histidine kinase [Chloroflexaceae bacterium]|nr:histidine kinase [Chloroflexaceae bacterium]